VRREQLASLLAAGTCTLQPQFSCCWRHRQCKGFA
jgi:hypothetical protein